MKLTLNEAESQNIKCLSEYECFKELLKMVKFLLRTDVPRMLVRGDMIGICETRILFEPEKIAVCCSCSFIPVYI